MCKQVYIFVVAPTRFTFIMISHGVDGEHKLVARGESRRETKIIMKLVTRGGDGEALV